MLRFPSAIAAAMVLLSLAACTEVGPGLIAQPEQLAPPIPVDNRPKALFQQMTGINSDAVAAISGDAHRTYVYYDLFAARKDAVKAAPAKLCSYYGSSLKSAHTVEPGDRVPGVKTLVVECN
jgi:hypothetical protein